MLSITRKSSALSAALIVFALVMSACGGSTPAATTAPTATTTAAAASPTLGPVVKLAFGVSGVSPLTVAYRIALDGGFWKKQNLDVTLVDIAGDPAKVQALVSDQAQVVAIGGSSFFTAAAAGGDLLLIGSLLDTVTDVICVTPDIKTAADLKGKKYGISTVGSETQFQAKLALKALGLDPEKDVTYVAVGGEGPRLAALKAGTISAGGVGIGNDAVIASSGLHVLASLLDLKVPAINAGLTVNRSWYNNNKDVAKRFMTGFVDAIHYFKTNKQGSLPIMANYLQQTDMTAVGSSYDAVSAIYRRSPTAPLAGAQAAIDYLASGTTPAAKSLDPAKFIDNSILDGLQSSGFIDNLYK